MSTFKITPNASLRTFGYRDADGNKMSKSEYEYIKAYQRELEVENNYDRDFSLYKGFFDLNEDELKGKYILDVGSGNKETFSREASKFGAIVFSMTPALRLKKYQKKVRSGIKGRPDLVWQQRSVAARAQAIPFPDNSFDYVLCFNSVPMYIRTFDDLYLAVKELLRVVKPKSENGKIMITRNGCGGISNELPNIFVKWIKKNGCTYSLSESSGAYVITKPSKLKV